MANEVANPPHQGPTAGQHDAAINDVGCQLRRGAFERALHRFNNHVEGLSDGLTKIPGLELNRARQTRQQVQATHIHHRLIEVVVWECGTDSNLDVFCGALTHHQVVNLFEMDTDRIADFITGNANGFTQHSATKAEHRHFGGSTADIHNHRANWLSHRQTSTNRRGHGLIDEMHFPGTGQAGLTHGAALHTGDTAGDPHHQAWGNDSAPLIAFLNEAFEHLLSRIKISDHAITQGPHRTNVPGRTAEHQLCFITNSKGHPPLEINRHH